MGTVQVCPTCHGKGSEPGMMQTMLTFPLSATLEKAKAVPCLTCKGHRLLVTYTWASLAGNIKETRPLESMHKHHDRPSRN